MAHNSCIPAHGCEIPLGGCGDARSSEGVVAEMRIAVPRLRQVRPSLRSSAVLDTGRRNVLPLIPIGHGISKVASMLRLLEADGTLRVIPGRPGLEAGRVVGGGMRVVGGGMRVGGAKGAGGASRLGGLWRVRTGWRARIGAPAGP